MLAREVAPQLRLTAADAVALGVADAVIPDAMDATVEALARALDDARPGDGMARFDRATARWLRQVADPAGSA